MKSKMNFSNITKFHLSLLHSHSKLAIASFWSYTIFTKRSETIVKILSHCRVLCSRYSNAVIVKVWETNRFPIIELVCYLLEDLH